jgi:hypothetical protein
MYSSVDKVLKEIQNFLGYGKIYLKISTGVSELTLANKKDCLNFLTNIKDKLVIKNNMVKYLLENYSFKRDNNRLFDLKYFRILITRKNVTRIQRNLF